MLQRIGLMLLATWLAMPAVAEAASRIRFAPGADSATLRGTIVGYETRDFVVGARAGQVMTVTMTTGNRSASFNILPAGSREAIFIGSVGGNAFTGRLARSGDFVISVGMMRNAARRGEVANFRLSVRIAGGAGQGFAEPPANDFADGLTGGPDIWRVAGVPPSDLLNIRRSPSPSAPVVASVPNGTRLANGGCRMVSGSRWCMVDVPGGSGLSGWANGRFLRE